MHCVLITCYCFRDYSMEDWRGVTFSMHEGDQKHQILLRNPLEKRPRCKQKDDIQVGWNGMQ
jgi:hypothetical protein